MNIAISKDSSIPLHTQLLNELRHRVLSGEWPVGSNVPSEHTLQTQLGISRSTIRQALNAAKAEGLIETVPGKGAFVSQRQSKSSHRIGFVIPYFRSSFDSQLLKGAESALREKDYRIVFCSSESQVPEEDRLLRLLVRDQVAGVLIWPVMGDDPNRFLFDLARQAVPIALMDRTVAGLEADVILCDNFRGGYLATQHLIALGHRRIVFLCRPHLNLLPIAERLRGYRQAMRDARLELLDPLFIGEQQEIRSDYALRSYTDASGEDIRQIRRCLAPAQCATAIFTMNDLMAMQVLRAAELEGVKIPHELSVVGFDDLDFVSHLSVPLTTVAQDPFALGHEAARRLMERIEGIKSRPRQIILPTQLVVRASTAAPSLL